MLLFAWNKTTICLIFPSRIITLGFLLKAVGLVAIP